MEYAALAFALFALVLALAARGAAMNARQRAEDAEIDAKRRAENVSEELKEELATTRALLAQVVAGSPPTPEMVRDGQLWRDADPAEGQRMTEGDARVVDVRTSQELAMGKIPGALHIPVDEIEERMNELPRDGRATLVYCAGGGRSAAACEFLSQKGYTNLHNLTGGFGAWAGPVERP